MKKNMSILLEKIAEHEQEIIKKIEYLTEKEENYNPELFESYKKELDDLLDFSIYYMSKNIHVISEEHMKYRFNNLKEIQKEINLRIEIDTKPYEIN